jgi:hypothetical protein
MILILWRAISNELPEGSAKNNEKRGWVGPYLSVLPVLTPTMNATLPVLEPPLTAPRPDSRKSDLRGSCSRPMRDPRERTLFRQRGDIRVRLRPVGRARQHQRGPRQRRPVALHSRHQSGNPVHKGTARRFSGGGLVEDPPIEHRCLRRKGRKRQGSREKKVREEYRRRFHLGAGAAFRNGIWDQTEISVS